MNELQLILSEHDTSVAQEPFNSTNEGELDKTIGLQKQETKLAMVK